MTTCSTCPFGTAPAHPHPTRTDVLFCSRLERHVEPRFFCGFHPERQGTTVRIVPRDMETAPIYPPDVEAKQRAEFTVMTDAELDAAYGAAKSATRRAFILREQERRKAEAGPLDPRLHDRLESADADRYDNKPEEMLDSWQERMEQEQAEEERLDRIASKLEVPLEELRQAADSLGKDTHRETYLNFLESLQTSSMALDRSTMDEKTPPSLDGYIPPLQAPETPSCGLQELSRKLAAMADAHAELNRAIRLYPPMHSYAEGVEVIREELEELIQETRLKPSLRDKAAIREEAVQLTAMSLRFLIDLT